MVVMSISCQPVDQMWSNDLELWISTELAPENHFHKAKMKTFKESVLHRLVDLFPRDFCASSWDREAVLKNGKNVRRERSEYRNLGVV